MTRNKLFAILLSIALVSAPLLRVGFVYAAPTPPAPPSPPSAPEAPEAPEAPDAPPAPEAPTAPETPSPEPEEESSEGESNPPESPSENTSSGEQTNSETISGSDDPDEPDQETTNGGGASDEPDYSDATGGTSQDKQTGADSEIDTGDAEADLVFTNTANWNQTAAGSQPGTQANLSNQKNGAESDNDIIVNDNSETSFTQENNLIIDNDFDIELSTGNNSASKNTNGDNKIKTGDASASVTLINIGNTNLAGAAVEELNVLDDQTGDIYLSFANADRVALDEMAAENSGNGADSQNDIVYQDNDTLIVYQKNFADVENDLDITVDTGHNTASKNTGGDNSIETGDATITANIVNFLNNNILATGELLVATVNIVGDFVGDIILPRETGLACDDNANYALENSKNGAGSENNLSLDKDSATTIDQTNLAQVENNFKVNANTSGNDLSKNTGGDNKLETGDVEVDVAASTVANRNIIGDIVWLVIVNPVGEWLGSILGYDSGVTQAMGSYSLANSGNGAGSTNNISATDSDSTQVVQENEVYLVNNLNLSANTGGNTASMNTNGDNSIETGDAKVSASVANFLNNNIVGKRVMVVFVNVLGSFLGNIITPDQDLPEVQAATGGPDGSEQLASNTAVNIDTNGNTHLEAEDGESESVDESYSDDGVTTDVEASVNVSDDGGDASAHVSVSTSSDGGEVSGSSISKEQSVSVSVESGGSSESGQEAEEEAFETIPLEDVLDDGSGNGFNWLYAGVLSLLLAVVGVVKKLLS